MPGKQNENQPQPLREGYNPQERGYRPHTTDTDKPKPHYGYQPPTKAGDPQQPSPPPGDE